MVIITPSVEKFVSYTQYVYTYFVLVFIAVLIGLCITFLDFSKLPRGENFHQKSKVVLIAKYSIQLRITGTKDQEL